MEQSIYKHLARHMSMMGLPPTQDLVDILEQNFTQEEAKTAMMLPSTDIPLKPVTLTDLAASSDMDIKYIKNILDALVEKKLIFSGRTETGEMGYALHHAGFGFPQAFFWEGKKTPEALKMSKQVLKYFNRDVTKKAFAGGQTKPYRYIPIHQSLTLDTQAVLPHDLMDTVIENAAVFAVAHCPCRIQAELMERACHHSVEVCLKFDEMAQYLIDQGLGRQISQKEAKAIVRKAAQEGLVHFVDNSADKVKHNCNCCGCACWNVGTIRRRKIPRDELMAVYFVRRTDPDVCAGCEACVEFCPVDAIEMKDNVALVDEDWCIGCGVCALKCEFDALNIVYRDDIKEVPKNFEILHNSIRKEIG